MFRYFNKSIDRHKLCIWLLELPDALAQAGVGFGDDEDVIEWFCNQGGKNTTIDVLIQLKDVIGRVVYDYPYKVPIKTQLVYEDGAPVPVFKANGRDKVYVPMRDEPILGQGVGAHFFAFRINDVSLRHKGHGFKLKVSTSGNIKGVADGLMEQILVGKLKPKSGPSGDQIGGRTTLFQKSCDGAVPYLLSNSRSSSNSEDDATPSDSCDETIDDASLSNISTTSSPVSIGKGMKENMSNDDTFLSNTSVSTSTIYEEKVGNENTSIDDSSLSNTSATSSPVRNRKVVKDTTSDDDSSVSNASSTSPLSVNVGKVDRGSINQKDVNISDRNAIKNQSSNASVAVAVAVADISSPRRGGNENSPFTSKHQSPVACIDTRSLYSPISARKKQDNQTDTMSPNVPPNITRTFSTVFEADADAEDKIVCAQSPNIKRNREFPSSVSNDIDPTCTESESSTCIRIVKKEDVSSTTSTDNDKKEISNNTRRYNERTQTVLVPSHEILTLFTAGDNKNRCIACNERLITGYETGEHKVDCRLGLTLAPAIMLARIQMNMKDQTNRGYNSDDEVVHVLSSSSSKRTSTSTSTSSKGQMKPKFVSDNECINNTSDAQKENRVVIKEEEDSP